MTERDANMLISAAQNTLLAFLLRVMIMNPIAVTVAGVFPIGFHMHWITVCSSMLSTVGKITSQMTVSSYNHKFTPSSQELAMQSAFLDGDDDNPNAPLVLRICAREIPTSPRARTCDGTTVFTTQVRFDAYPTVLPFTNRTQEQKVLWGGMGGVAG